MRKTLIALLAMVAIVVVITVVRMNKQQEPEEDGQATPVQTSGPIITYAAEVPRVVVEIEEGDVVAPAVKIKDAGASGQGAVEIPENPDEAGQELNPKLRTAEGKPASYEEIADGRYQGTPLYPNGMVRVSFEIAQPGEYEFWVRAWWRNGCANSFYFRVDPVGELADGDGNGSYDDEVIPEELDGGGNYRIWDWTLYNKAVFELDAGQHVLEIYNREDGIRLDQVLFVKHDPENSYIPSGIEESSGE